VNSSETKRNLKSNNLELASLLQKKKADLQAAQIRIVNLQEENHRLHYYERLVGVLCPLSNI
jgi:hypothetical protein